MNTQMREGARFLGLAADSSQRPYRTATARKPHLHCYVVLAAATPLVITTATAIPAAATPAAPAAAHAVDGDQHAIPGFQLRGQHRQLAPQQVSLDLVRLSDAPGGSSSRGGGGRGQGGEGRAA